ncbi:MAG: class I adenylate-forming enzyme family protein [Chthoniobacteraceae bacterium]
MSPLNHPNPILAAWQSTRARRGDAPAILAADGGVLRTFAGIHAETGAHEAMLEGLLPGAVVAMRLGNDARFPSLLLAAWRSGLIPLPVDRSLEKGALSAALAVCHASAFIAPAPDGSLVIERIDSSGRVDADFLKLTSGTTGAPRAIRFRAAQLVADCEAVCDTMGIREEDLNYGVIPWSHSYGFSNLVTPLLCRGVPVVATEERLPRALLDGLARSGASVFPGLPVFFQKLAELDPMPLPRLRLCISAGAPLTKTTADTFRARFAVKIHSFYGSSECGGIAYDAGEDETGDGCVGQPMRGVRLVHDEETGRIEVHGPAVGEGYFPEPDTTVLGDGRFVPGDLVRKTAQGLVLSGRVSDFINVAGRKLNPAEIELRLRECPGVREAVVFGVPSRLRGEEPIACVAGKVSASELSRWSREGLPGWQVPRDFWMVDALPVNERGKLSRRALADAYLSQQKV